MISLLGHLQLQILNAMDYIRSKILFRASYPFQRITLNESFSPPDKDIKSLIKLVDSNHDDAKGDKSGFLLYDNKAVCADDCIYSASDRMCRLLGYLNSQRWKAREINKTYEINTGTLVCGSENQKDPCNFQHMGKCETSKVIFLYCTGSIILLVSTQQLSIN